VKAESSFWTKKGQEGKTLFPAKNGVAFCGSNMGFSEKLIRYQFEREMNLPAELVFVWTDPNGSDKSVKFTPAQVGDFQIKQQEKQYQLELDAEPLDKNEKLTLLLDGDGGEKANIEFKGPSLTSTLDIADNAVAKFKTGKTSFSVVRTKTFYDEQDNCACTVTQSYYTGWKKVDFR